MRRREFIGLVGEAAVTLPLAARAQQAERMRRIGALMNLAADDPEALGRITAFVQGLQQLGWSDGRNARIIARWAAGNDDNFRKYSAELVALAPDAILATSTPAVLALQQATHTVPIVFVTVIDPVGAGMVASLARPGGNTTGFTVFEYGMSGKWVELLKEIAPGVRRVAVLRDLTIGIAQLAAIQAVAPSLGVELSVVGTRGADEIERAVTDFARSPNGGLIVTAGTTPAIHRELISTLAARHQLPAVYPFRYYVTAGGLISYGPDSIDPYREAAGYVPTASSRARSRPIYQSRCQLSTSL
jgi:putative tryptophan/tyrosine transport system substrate-binding protein